MICVCVAVFVWVFLCFVMWLWLCVVDGCVVCVGECGYGSIGGPDPELGTGEGNKGLIELAGIRCGSHFPFSFLILVLCSWEDQENIRGKNLMLVSAVNPTLIIYQLYFYALTMNHARERNVMCVVRFV